MVQEPAGLLPEDRSPLTGQNVLSHPPALSLGPEQAVLGNSHLVEEGLAELIHPGHGVERVHLDAGTVHVDEERADAA